MARLLIRDGPPGLREVQLRPGVNRIGRALDNDYPIPDGSVSGHHCELDLRDGEIGVHDLGSTNGTFIDDRQVQDGVFRPGQVLRLGRVGLTWPGAAPVGVAVDVPAPAPTPAAVRVGATRVAPTGPAPPLPVPSPENGTTCPQHPGTPAPWRCVACGQLACAACVKVLRAGVQEFRSCPHCGGTCVKAEGGELLRARGTGDFFRLLPGAFAYPLKKEARFLLACLSGFFILLGVLQFLASAFLAGLLFGAYWLLAIISGGYLFAYMQSIVQSSGNGAEKLPDLPEVSEFWSDIFLPFVRLAVIWPLCVAPGFLVMVLVNPLAGLPLLLLGVFCMPMALLTVAMADSLRGLNPLIILSGIAKAPLPYLAICGVFLLLMAAPAALQVASFFTGLWFLPVFLGVPLSIYSLTVEMRLLGLLYLTHQEKFAWFE